MSGVTFHTPKGHYQIARFCNVCDHRLTNDEFYYSQGVCPYCGHISGSTLIDARVASEFVPEDRPRAIEREQGFFKFLGDLLGRMFR